MSINGAAPIAGLFHGKSQSKMDDEQGYPYFRKPPYHLDEFIKLPFDQQNQVLRGDSQADIDFVP